MWSLNPYADGAFHLFLHFYIYNHSAAEAVEWRKKTCFKVKLWVHTLFRFNENLTTFDSNAIKQENEWKPGAAKKHIKNLW